MLCARSTAFNSFYLGVRQQSSIIHDIIVILVPEEEELSSLF